MSLAYKTGRGPQVPILGPGNPRTPLARKRRLAPPQVVADNYHPSAHNQSMNRNQSRGLSLVPGPLVPSPSVPSPVQPGTSLTFQTGDIPDTFSFSAAELRFTFPADGAEDESGW